MKWNFFFLSDLKLFSIFTFLFFILFFTACSSQAPKNELFIYSTMDEPLIQKLSKAYLEETGNKLQFVRLSTGEAAARIDAEKKNPQASLWLGGIALNHQQLKERGLSEAYQPLVWSEIPNEYKDPQSFWTGLYIGILAFASNKEQLKKLESEAPRSWAELTNKKFKNQIQLAHPGTSGTSYNVMAALIAKDGEKSAFDFFQKLHANVSQYTRSGSAPAKNAAIGETAVAVGYAHDIARLIHEDKAPLELSFPKEGTGYEIASISLIKGGKQQELAKDFYNWMYSKTASQILADYYVYPLIQNGVQMKEKSINPAAFPLIHFDIDWAGKNRERLVNQWNEKINS